MLKIITMIMMTVTSVFGGKLTDAQQYYENEFNNTIIEDRREMKEDEQFEGHDVVVEGKVTWLDEDTCITGFIIKIDKDIYIEVDTMVDIDEDGDVDYSNVMCYILNDNVYAEDTYEFDEAMEALFDEYGIEY